MRTRIIQAYQRGGPYDAAMAVFAPIHAEYCARHGYEYTLIPEAAPSAWSRVIMVRDALIAGVDNAVFIDSDAVIADMDANIEDALPANGIGTVEHPAGVSPYGRHRNVGVLFARDFSNCIKLGAIDVLDLWISFRGSSHDCDPGHEQNAYNVAVVPVFPNICRVIPDKWNATLNVNMCDNPAIIAAHGQGPQGSRHELLIRWMKEKGKVPTCH